MESYEENLEKINSHKKVVHDSTKSARYSALFTKIAGRLCHVVAGREKCGAAFASIASVRIQRGVDSRELGIS